MAESEMKIIFTVEHHRGFRFHGMGEWDKEKWTVSEDGMVIRSTRYEPNRFKSEPASELTVWYQLSDERFRTLKEFLAEVFPSYHLHHAHDAGWWTMTSFDDEGNVAHKTSGFAHWDVESAVYGYLEYSSVDVIKRERRVLQQPEVPVVRTSPTRYPSLTLECAGERLDFYEERITIGRDPHCDIVLKAATVSRKHAVILRRRYRWFICDNSKNGTYVNGKKIPEGEFYALSAGDRIVFANEERSYYIFKGWEI